ncbi:MAG: thiamine pyrophosphate-binding protein [Desulfarculaceae bacterium]|nr:thiamine pyrophosphate-binding protein [Desulfarculaceae bacterium]
MTPKVTTYLLEALKAEGISHVFMVPGGLVDPFLPAFSEVEGLTPIVACQEGGAAYMADGYARASNRFGTCLVIGGPGITNTATAVEAARTDGSPMLVVSGQVPTDWEGRGGFQDSSPAALDDISILRPLSLASFAVESPALVRHHLRACLERMLAGGRGPVHLSLPLDVQKSPSEEPWAPLDGSHYRPAVVDLKAMERLWALLAPPEGGAGLEKICILAGAGVEKAAAWDELRRFAERYEIPVATTLRAKGVLPENHRLSLGVFGYAGHRHAIETMLSGEVELLIVLGSGLLQRDSMFWDPKMLPQRSLVHVDIDPTVPGRTWPVELPLVGDCGQVLRELMNPEPARDQALKSGIPARAAWLEGIRALGGQYYDEQNQGSEAVPLHPARVIAELRKAMPPEGALVVDSGAHRAFAGHYWKALRPHTYYSATNLGPMGWAIPAAVGIKAARPGTPLAVITSDGCMMMHGMEIQTAARYGLPVVYVVLNNSALANVWLRAHQEGPGPDALTSLPTHDWAGFARSLGLEAATVSQPGELAGAFEQALGSGKAYLLDVRCDKKFTTPVTPYSQAKKEWVDDH